MADKLVPLKRQNAVNGDGQNGFKKCRKEQPPIQLIAQFMPTPMLTIPAYLCRKCAFETSKRQCLVTPKKTFMNIVLCQDCMSVNREIQKVCQERAPKATEKEEIVLVPVEPEPEVIVKPKFKVVEPKPITKPTVAVVDKETMTEQEEDEEVTPEWVDTQFKVVKALFMLDDPQASKRKAREKLMKKRKKFTRVARKMNHPQRIRVVAPSVSILNRLCNEQSYLTFFSYYCYNHFKKKSFVPITLLWMN